MGLFDFGNKTKAYKRGTEDASQVDNQKLKELSDAEKVSQQNLEGSLNLLKDDFDDVNDILTGDAKEKLLGLVEQLTFKDDLDDTSKEFLVATLVTLANEIGETSDIQKRYLRSLSHYLEVTPGQDCDIYGIENITDSEESQLIFRAVNEYLFLRDGSFSLEEDNEKIKDYFDYFNINNRTKKKVITDIQNRVEVMGNEGLVIPFEVTEEEIHASEKPVEDTDVVEEEDDSESIDEQMTELSRILEPLDYFQNSIVSRYPNADIMQAREICQYHYLDLSKENVVAVMSPREEEAFGEINKHIGVVFLKDRIISNRLKYGWVSKKNVEFHMVPYSDIQMEGTLDKKYIAYNGAEWNTFAPKQAGKMTELLDILKEDSPSILDGTFIGDDIDEYRGLSEEDNELEMTEMANILEPIMNFKGQSVSMYPEANIKKAWDICGFQYMDVDENNVVAVMVPEDYDVIWGPYKYTVGVVFLRDGIVSNRLPIDEFSMATKLSFNVSGYSELELRNRSGRHVVYDDASWNLVLDEDANQMIEIIKRLVEKDSEWWQDAPE